MRRREHTVQQDDRFIRTRLFRVGQIGLSTSVDTSKDSNLRVVEEPKIFSDNGFSYLGVPPEQSIYGLAMLSKKNTQTNDYTYNLAKWITVFCINPDEKDEIVDFFSKYGEISNVIPPSRNYLSLEFVKSSDVDNIINERQPIIVKSGNAVICKRGRYTTEKFQIDRPPAQHYQTFKDKVRSEVTIWELIQDFYNFIKWNFC